PACVGTWRSRPCVCTTRHGRCAGCRSPWAAAYRSRKPPRGAWPGRTGGGGLPPLVPLGLEALDRRLLGHVHGRSLSDAHIAPGRPAGRAPTRSASVPGRTLAPV